MIQTSFALFAQLYYLPENRRYEPDFQYERIPPALNRLVSVTSSAATMAFHNERQMPAGIITMSPWTNLNYRRYKPPYVGKNRADNPYISPVYGEYNDFSPMLMQVGGDEALLNDTVIHVSVEDA